MTFNRPEPLFHLPEKSGVIAGASAGLALIAALATGLVVRRRGR